MDVALEGVQLSRGMKADVSLVDAKLSELADRSLNPTPCDRMLRKGRCLKLMKPCKGVVVLSDRLRLDLSDQAA